MIKGPIGRILPGTERPDSAADQLRLPTLDERTNLYLRAINSERDFTNQEYSNARNFILDEMAANIAAESASHLPHSDLAGMLQGTDFDQAAALAASFFISDEYPRDFQSSPETFAESADYSLGMRQHTNFHRPSAVLACLRIEKLPETFAEPADASAAQSSPVSPRRRLVARRRLFIGAAAIAATILLLAGAYRLALHTAPESRVATQIPPPTPKLPEKPGSAVSATQDPDTALMRGPSTPTIVYGVLPRKVDAIAEMVQHGQALMASGRILAARFALKEAADAGSAEAALTLGMTYDPTELENLAVRDVPPEADVARHWYQKAKSLGSTEAQGRLDSLRVRERGAH